MICWIRWKKDFKLNLGNMSKIVYHQGVESLTIRDKRINGYWRWRPAKKFLGYFFVYQEEGFYFSWDKFPTSIEEIERSDNVVIDKQVYKKPCLKFNMMSGESHEIYFDRVSEIYDYIEEKGLQSIPYVKI